MTLDDLDLMDATTPPMLAPAGRRPHRHTWTTYVGDAAEGAATYATCHHCGATRDETAARRGRQSRNYGNRAELSIAKTYGGTKVGHAGGPVDVRGKEFATQVRTKRRLAPREWVSAIDAMAGSERIPRLLIRFVQTGGVAPDDWMVFRAKDFLDWFGRDE